MTALVPLAGIAIAGPPLARRAGLPVNLPWSSSPTPCPPTPVELAVIPELVVFITNRGNPSSRLVAVYPQNGSPSLDYPIARVAPYAKGPARSLFLTVKAARQD